MSDLSDLLNQTIALHADAEALRARLNIAAREEKLAEVAQRAEDPQLWDDPDNAQQVMSEQARRRTELHPWRRLASLSEDALVLAELASEAEDSESVAEINANLAEIRALLDRLHTEALFADAYDTSNAILEINAGAGGTEACDWAEMLGRMYLRWAERHGFQAEIIDSLPGDQAGVKSMTIEIQGTNAYGYLKSERGTASAHPLLALQREEQPRNLFRLGGRHPRRGRRRGYRNARRGFAGRYLSRQQRGRPARE